MKCVICNGPTIEPKMVEEEIKAGNDIVLLNINVLVCRDCGERYYDKRSMRNIEEVRRKVRRRELKLDVVGNVYRAKSA